MCERKDSLFYDIYDQEMFLARLWIRFSVKEIILIKLLKKFVI